MRSVFTYIYLFTLIFVPLFGRASEFNVGIVQGLWYSTSTIYANVPVRVYIALRNSSKEDLTGMVRFSDNGSSIGTSPVNALSGRIVEAWADWTPRRGTHTITASLYNVALNTIGTDPQQITADDTIATDTILVYDAPATSIGNTKNVVSLNNLLTSGASFPQNLEGALAAALPTSSTQGLEQYLPDGTTNNIVSTVTKTLTAVKTSVDSYRNAQTDALAPYFSSTGTTTPSLTLASTSTTPTFGTATITRTKLPDNSPSFLVHVIASGKALVSGFFSFLLFILSTMLGYPAILEVLLLLGILYSLYRIARKFGRRKQF